MSAYLGFVFILLTAVFWGIVGVLARFLLASGMGPEEIAFWRSVLACILFGAAAAATRQQRLRAGKDIFGFMIFGVVCLACLFLSYTYAVKEGGAALTVVLQYTAPAWVVVFSRFLFAEPLTRRKCLALMISLAGVAAVSLSGGTGSSGMNVLGVGLGLLSGVLAAVQFVSTKKLVAFYSPFAIYGYGFFFSALTLYPFVDFVEKSPLDWVILLVLGVVCTCLAFFFYAAGVKRLEASTASIICTFEPVVATLAAWLIWNETFRPLGILGIVMVIGAVLMLVLGPAPRTRGEGAASTQVEAGEAKARDE